MFSSPSSTFYESGPRPKSNTKKSGTNRTESETELKSANQSPLKSNAPPFFFMGSFGEYFPSGSIKTLDQTICSINSSDRQESSFA